MIRHDDRLLTIEPRLADVVRKAAGYLSHDILVVEGIRTLERQKQLFAANATRTLKSKHLVGRAVDLAPVLDGELRWDWPLFPGINAAMQRAAAELNTSIIWGGSWRTFRDGPHWELA